MLSRQVERIRKNQQIQSLLGILKLVDEEAYNHSLSVEDFVAEYLSLEGEEGLVVRSKKEREDILKGALLHDIGKAFLPFGLQHSYGKLNSYEMDIMRMHPLLGKVSIQNAGFGEIVENIVLYHHENGDGTGYSKPFSKESKEIPDYVWIVAYADRFEAMTSNRAFKKGVSYPEAWKKLLEMSRSGILPFQYARLFGKVVKKKSLLRIEK